MTRLEFLKDTVTFYSEDVNRRAKIGNNCSYKLNDGRCCAIGRHLTNEEYSKKWEDLSVVSIFSELPEKLKNLGMEFLKECQWLHDYNSNWNESGLSDEGKLKVEEIKKKYCNE